MSDGLRPDAGLRADGPPCAGVIGWPVSHSLSPHLHNFWLEKHGITGSYQALSVTPDELEPFLRALPGRYAGVNVTIPHKERALALVDSCDAIAQTIGAVNTIVVRDGALHGTNTDAYGFLKNLEIKAPHRQGRDALILGAGGASRAVIYALLQSGMRVTVTNRSPERAYMLQEKFAGIAIIPWEDIPAHLAETVLLVNTTALGMAGQPPLALDVSLLPKHAVVADIVYKPLLTPLIKAAATRGLGAVDGLGMLLYQAQAGFNAWFGLLPEVDESLRDHMLAGLDA